MSVRMVTRGGTIVLAFAAFALLGGCEPQVGTKAWCDKMSAKPKGDWTANEAADFAKSCVLGTPKS